MSSAARREIRTRSRLTGQHMYWLSQKEIREKSGEAMLLHLRGQARTHEFDKRDEAQRRENR